MYFIASADLAGKQRIIDEIKSDIKNVMDIWKYFYEISALHNP